MKKYNSFLGAFFSGDSGQGGYNAAYEKKSLANLYGGNLAPEQEQEALSGLSRVNPEAANKWQEETVKKSAQLLLALGKDNPVAQQAWQTRIKPNLSRIYGAQAASLPDLPDDSVMAVAQQIAGGAQQGAEKPASVREAEYFAEQAGLKPGTPAYVDFMKNKSGGFVDPNKWESGISQNGVVYQENKAGGFRYRDPNSGQWIDVTPSGAKPVEEPKPPHNGAILNDDGSVWANFDEMPPEEVAAAKAAQAAQLGGSDAGYEVRGGKVAQIQPSPTPVTQSGNVFSTKPKTVVRLTPEQVAAEGLPPGTIAQRDEATGAISILDKPAKGATFSDTNTLRDDYTKAIAQPMAMMDAYEKMRQAYQDPSAAGDIALIYAYMKILDPNSVVRETEFATAENAASVPDSIRNQWNRALTGERVKVNRQDFLNQGVKLYAGAKAKYNQIRQQFGGIIERNGINPSDVLVDGHIPISQKFPPKGGGKYSVGQVLNINGKRYKVTGGDLNSDPDLEEMP